MSLPPWSAAVLVGLIVLLIVWQLVSAIRRLRAVRGRWKPLRGTVSFSYDSTAPIDPEYLLSRVSSAVLALASHGPWDRVKLTKALTGVRVFVSTEEEWKSIICSNRDCKEGTIAGATFPESGMVAVNASLGSLCHEFAHVAEFRLDGDADYTHATWPTRGITTAIAAFERVTRSSMRSG